MSPWDYYRYFPPSRPRAAKGGIKAQSKHGSFAQKWWAKRWVAVLEGFNLGARLQRGRSYARSGQVLSIAVEKGTVTARVQGSRPKPYDVKIQEKPLARRAWQKLAETVSRQAIFGAKLLDGEMPQGIEEVFRSAGLSLFPERSSDLQTDCSCPDWSNPCKHIAAVYYLLGEEFDRDPFLIFKLRGIDREEFLGLLGEKPSATPTSFTADEPPAAEPLPDSPALFWNGGAIPENLVEGVDLPTAGAALPRRLGKFPFWRSSEDLLDALERVYRSAAANVVRVLSQE
jgi:uncharacterized Zn finger protein